MLKNWKTKDLVVIALLAASWIVLDLIFASFLNAITGIPLTSAMITGVIAAFFMVLAIKILPRFGSLTIMLTLFGLLEMPTSLGGYPGFWPKIIINGLSGFFGDVWLVFTGYKKTWNLFVGFYILAAVNLFTFIYFLIKMGVPNAEKTFAIWYYILPVYWIMGTIGIFLGMLVWRKIKDKKIVRQITN